MLLWFFSTCGVLMHDKRSLCISGPSTGMAVWFMSSWKCWVLLWGTPSWVSLLLKIMILQTTEHYLLSALEAKSLKARWHATSEGCWEGLCLRWLLGFQVFSPEQMFPSPPSSSLGLLHGVLSSLSLLGHLLLSAGLSGYPRITPF